MTEATISASSATAPSATVNEQLANLVQRAGEAAIRPSTNTRNAALLHEMSVTIVALAQRIVQLQAEQAERPRIIPA